MSAPEALTVVRAGRLIATEAGEVRTDQAIVIRGDRVEGLVPFGDMVPQADRTIDLTTHTVLPG